MKKVIIHISDLHVTYHTDELGKVNKDTCLTTDPDKSESCNSFIKKVAISINKKFENHEKYLIITGDIADKAEIPEYRTAVELIKLLLNELKITDKSRISIIPGDHDWHNRSVENAIAEKLDKGIEFSINEVKYQNFNAELYNKIKNKNFDNKSIVFEKIDVGDNILLLSLNSTLKIEKKGDKGDFDIAQLRTELENIINENSQKHLLMAFHHNISGAYDNTTTGNVNEVTWGNLLGLLNENKIKCIFHGNEHTHNSRSIGTNIFTSDAGTLSGITQPRGTFKCYEIIEEAQKITLFNYIGKLDKTDSLEETGFGNWDLHKVSKSENEKIDEFILFDNTEKAPLQPLNLPESTSSNEEQKDVKENTPKTTLKKEIYKYNNQHYVDKLYQIIKEKKLFHTGHFHWTETSRALNWIDTMKLLECYEDLWNIKNTFIDVLQSVKNNFQAQNSTDLNYDLIVGLGYQGTIISVKAAMQLDIPFVSLPYSYRYEDHNQYEKELNVDKEQKYKNVVIITDVVRSGSTIDKLINEQQKVFFDNVENIFVISLIYTGKEEKANQITFGSYKTQFIYVLHLEVAECPHKGKVEENCRVEDDRLSDVLYFHSRK